MFNFLKRKKNGKDKVKKYMENICDEYSKHRYNNQNKDGSRLLFDSSITDIYFRDSLNTLNGLDFKELNDCVAKGMTEDIAYSILMDAAAQRLSSGSRSDFLSLVATPATEAILFIRYLCDKELELKYITEEKYKEVSDWVQQTIQSSI